MSYQHGDHIITLKGYQAGDSSQVLALQEILHEEEEVRETNPIVQTNLDSSQAKDLEVLLQ